jgi:hypothetical protein
VEDDYADSVLAFAEAVDMAVNLRRGCLTYKQAADELRRIAEAWEEEEEE